MKNLAGNDKADLYIREELNRCGIDIVNVDKYPGEVSYTLEGRLSLRSSEFVFKRAWYYWVVTGRVPLQIAHTLYENPVGRVDIRVNGNCGCPAPAGNQVEWRTKDEREIWSRKSMDEV